MMIVNRSLLLLSNHRSKKILKWNITLSRMRSSTAAAVAVQTDEFKSKWDAAKPFNQIPGPKTYPVIKNLPYQFTGLPGKFEEFFKTFNHLYNTFGPLVRWEIPLIPPMLFAFSPEYVENILKDGVSSRPVRDVLHYVKIYRTETRKEWFGDNGGVLIESGDKWYDVRSKVQQPMMRPKSAVLYVDGMDEVANEFIQRIKNIRDNKNEVPEDFQNELYKWALESVGIVALNARLGCLDPDMETNSDGQLMIDAVNKLFALMGELEFNIPVYKYVSTKKWRQFVKEFDVLSQVSIKHINQAHNNLLQKDLKEIDVDDLSVLEKFLLTPGLSKGNAYTMAMDMLLAGIDTSGNQMGFLLYLLSKFPETQKKLQAEIDRVIPDVTKPITDKQLNAMPYMKAALKESLRILPAASGFARNLDYDTVIGGYQVPKGTLVFNGMMIMARDEKNFPSALEFRPERWIRGDSQANDANPYAFLPFGHGARMCIGRRLAEQEMYILTAKILKNFWVEYHYKDVEIVSRMVNVPSEPLKFRFIDRH